MRKLWLLALTPFLLAETAIPTLAQTPKGKSEKTELKGNQGSDKQKTVTGVVLSAEDGLPVIGATVKVEGTSRGTTTDMDGKFTLSSIQAGAKLTISYVGMISQTVSAKNGMKISLQPDAQQLDEVVVTGMQKMDKRLFTGATTRISAEDAKLNGMADISRSLEGRAAGVSVQNVSGTFGTAPKIRVRGATSIYGNSKPLWVVDGVIMDDVVEVSADQLSSGDAVTLISSAISGLNADDIESFQILKDGSATSIYGARAMAGVIAVTTKKGKAGTSKFNYTGEYTMRLKPNYRNFDIMNSQDQMDIYQELSDKGWLNFAETYRASKSGVYGKMYQLINQYDSSKGTFGLANTPEAKAAYLRQAEARNTDWFDLLFSNSIMMNHSISYTNGSDKSTSYVSLSAMTDPGWMKRSKVQRYTANLNNTYNMLKNVQLNVISNASVRLQEAPGTLSQSTDAVTGKVSRDFDINPYSFAMNTSRTLDADTYYMRNYSDFNIFNELSQNYISLNVVDLKMQAEMKWKILPTLEVSALGAVKYSATNQEHKIMDYSNQALAYRSMDDTTIRNANSWLYKNPDTPNSLPQSILPVGGFYNTTTYKMLSYDFRATVSWNEVFKDTHIVNLYAGMEQNAQNRSSNWNDGWGMQYENGEIPYFNYLAFKKQQEGNTPYYGLTETRRRNVAFFATSTYSYKGRYSLTGTIRYEGSNRLGKSRSARWLPTWNLSGAWNMYEESWFNKQDVLSTFTTRASYSLTADAGPVDVTNSRVVINSYTPWRASTEVGESGLEISDLENSNLTYEKKHELNIGADMGFLKNRINLSVDWYKRNNYDLIGLMTTQGVGGQTYRYANVASMKSHGVELTLSTRNIDTRDFKWSTDFTFGKSKTEVTDLKSRTKAFYLISGTGFAREGFPARGLFSIPFEGLDAEGYPMFRWGETLVTKSNYGTLNFQQTTDLDFLKYEGPTDPTINGSFGNTLTYKGFRLNVFFTYSAGNKLRLNPLFSNEYTDLEASSKEFKNRWRMAGDEAITQIPVIASARDNNDYSYLKYGYNAYNYSTARVADGGFVRLKEVSLSYDIPRQCLSKIFLTSASLKLQATNLCLLYADSKLNGQDPEFFNAGGVAAPVPRQFTLTLRLGF